MVASVIGEYQFRAHEARDHASHSHRRRIPAAAAAAAASSEGEDCRRNEGSERFEK